MKKLFVLAALFFALIVAVGLTSEPNSRGSAPTTPAGAYSHELLQQDGNMTQVMSTPDANGPMQSGQTTDAQLAHSKDPAFVRALEQHQGDIDRMLARPTP